MKVRFSFFGGGWERVHIGRLAVVRKLSVTLTHSLLEFPSDRLVPGGFRC